MYSGALGGDGGGEGGGGEGGGWAGAGGATGAAEATEESAGLFLVGSLGSQFPEDTSGVPKGRHTPRCSPKKPPRCPLC